MTRTRFHSTLNIPLKELQHIEPEIREKLFLDMLEEYKNRFPFANLRLGYLNWDSQFKNDYVIVFTFINKENGQRGIAYDCPLIYTKRSIPGYRYCKREGLLEDFFKDAGNELVAIDERKFFEYIQDYLELSLDKTSEKYWKKTENFGVLSQGLLELAVQATKI